MNWFFLLGIMFDLLICIVFVVTFFQMVVPSEVAAVKAAREAEVAKEVRRVHLAIAFRMGSDGYIRLHYLKQTQKILVPDYFQ